MRTVVLFVRSVRLLPEGRDIRVSIEDPLTRALAIGLRVSIATLVVCGPGTWASQETSLVALKIYRYHPKLRVPSSLESIQKHLVAGSDPFPDEKEAEELAARLSEMSARRRERPSRAAAPPRPSSPM